MCVPDHTRTEHTHIIVKESAFSMGSKMYVTEQSITEIISNYGCL